MIKHISFDLWLTLIQSHQDFKTKRAEYFADGFNPLNLSLREVFEIINNTDKACDRLNENSGAKVPAVYMYHIILKKLGFGSQNISVQVTQEIKSKIDKLFLKLQPRFLNPMIMSMLQKLKDEGYTLNISSNTGFIESDILVTTLKNMQIYDYFDFCIFSDAISYSKPSYQFFHHVYRNLNLEKSEILHIGDNYIADYEGAARFGFNALHITNSQYTINDITDYIHKNN